MKWHLRVPFFFCDKKMGMNRFAGDRLHAILVLCLFVMMGLPMLVGYGVVPYTNFGVEVVAVVGLGMLLISSAALINRSLVLSKSFSAALLLGIGLAAWILVKTHLFGGAVGFNTTLIYVGYVLGFCGAMWVGFLLVSKLTLNWVASAVVGILLVAASIASIGSAMQYFGVDGSWMGLSPAVDPGRTYGFVRQPNHQSTYIAMAIAALLCSRIESGLRSQIWYPAILLLTAALVSTGSRTGIISVFAVCMFYALFALFYWGKKGSVSVFQVLILLGLSWALFYIGAVFFDHEFYGLTKLNQTGSEGIGVRKELWLGTWNLILQRPFQGYAIHSFMPTFMIEGHVLSTKMVFENAHNMFLQSAFEFGVPMAIAIHLALIWLVVSFFRSLRFSYASRLFGGISLPIIIYAQFEYPLWYSHFLFPFGFFVGAYLGGVKLNSGDAMKCEVDTLKSGCRVAAFASVFLGLSLILGGISANREFYRVTPFFARFDDSSLQEKIEKAGEVFWLSNVVDLARYQSSNAGSSAQVNEDQLSLLKRLGCEHDEPWYQLSTLRLLAQMGYGEDAKWLIYLMSQLNPGSMSVVAAYFEREIVAGGGELSAYAKRPVTVKPSHRFFEEVCY